MYRSVTLTLMGLFTGVLFGLAITGHPGYWVPFSVFLITVAYFTATYSKQEKNEGKRLSKLEEDLGNAIRVIFDLVKEEPETVTNDSSKAEGEKDT
ncbi:hypothetical protein IKG06_03130 [Candidatus Saccharibacteria bacterium]|nr:hypothetical protein [Candidatus Saccharibacteria bacterium]